MVSVRELDEKHPMTAHLIKLTSPVSYPGIRVSEEEEWTWDLPVNIVKLEEKYDAKYKP